jgi:hypothetical protein
MPPLMLEIKGEKSAVSSIIVGIAGKGKGIFKFAFTVYEPD